MDMDTWKIYLECVCWASDTSEGKYIRQHKTELGADKLSVASAALGATRHNLRESSQTEYGHPCNLKIRQINKWNTAGDSSVILTARTMFIVLT